MSDITIRQMFEAGVHYGHQTRFWNPQMAPYIFGERNKIHIIDLDKTLPLFRTAMTFLRKSTAEGKTILFVSTKKPAQDIIKKYAIQCGMPYVNCRWLGGTLTNFKTIRRSVKRFSNLIEEQKKTNFAKLIKKQRLLKERELKKMERTLGGVKEMTRLPDILFIIDVYHEAIAVNEAKKLGLPVVAVVDSNSSFDNVDYIIPGNDDSMRAIDLYARAAADAVLTGLEEREESRDDSEAELGEETDTGPQITVKKKVSAVKSDNAEEA